MFDWENQQTIKILISFKLIVILSLQPNPSAIMNMLVGNGADRAFPNREVSHTYFLDKILMFSCCCGCSQLSCIYMT